MHFSIQKRTSLKKIIVQTLKLVLQYFMFGTFTWNLKTFTVQKPFILSLQYVIRVLLSQLLVTFDFMVSSLFGPKTLILTAQN
jgi:hypothetical protein